MTTIETRLRRFEDSEAIHRLFTDYVPCLDVGECDRVGRHVDELQRRGGRRGFRIPTGHVNLAGIR